MHHKYTKVHKYQLHNTQGINSKSTQLSSVAGIKSGKSSKSAEGSSARRRTRVCNTSTGVYWVSWSAVMVLTVPTTTVSPDEVLKYPQNVALLACCSKSTTQKVFEQLYFLLWEVNSSSTRSTTSSIQKVTVWWKWWPNAVQLQQNIQRHCQQGDLR